MKDKKHLLNTLLALVEQFDFAMISSMYFIRNGGIENIESLKIIHSSPKPKSVAFVDKAQRFKVNKGYTIDEIGFRIDVADKKIKYQYNPIFSEIVNEYWTAQRRYFGTITFELIKAYCSGTDQLGKMKSAPWYDFALLNRNFGTHHGRFKWPSELTAKKVYEVTNLDRTYTSDTKREDIRFDAADLISLALEQINWVFDELE